MITRLTEPQFRALVALTSLQPDSGTCKALYDHLVLGYSKPDACDKNGIIVNPVLNRALRRLIDADTAARAYVALLEPHCA